MKLRDDRLDSRLGRSLRTNEMGDGSDDARAGSMGANWIPLHGKIRRINRMKVTAQSPSCAAVAHGGASLPFTGRVVMTDGQSNGEQSSTRGSSMGWATAHIERLRKGEKVSFRPRGHSMRGRIESGQLCTVEPVDPAAVGVGDIGLCKVNGRDYLHLVKAIQGPRFQIGNNRGRVNGWVAAGAIFGKCVRVED